MDAQQKAASREAEIENMRQLIADEVDSKVTERHEQLVLEAEAQKKRVEYDLHKEARKQREIMQIEFEFQHN